MTAIGPTESQMPSHCEPKAARAQSSTDDTTTRPRDTPGAVGAAEASTRSMRPQMPGTGPSAAARVMARRAASSKSSRWSWPMRCQ